MWLIYFNSTFWCFFSDCTFHKHSTIIDSKFDGFIVFIHHREIKKLGLFWGLWYEDSCPPSPDGVLDHLCCWNELWEFVFLPEPLMLLFALSHVQQKRLRNGKIKAVGVCGKKWQNCCISSVKQICSLIYFIINANKKNVLMLFYPSLRSSTCPFNAFLCNETAHPPSSLSPLFDPGCCLCACAPHWLLCTVWRKLDARSPHPHPEATWKTAAMGRIRKNHFGILTFSLMVTLVWTQK